MFEVSTEPPQPKAELVNPNVISKKYDSQNRQEVTRNILDARSEQRALRTLPVQAEDSKEKKAQIQLNLDEKEAQLQARMNSLLVRLKTGIGIKDEQVVQMETDLQTLQTLKQQARDELETLREKIFLLETKQHLNPSPSPKEILTTYNEKMLGKPLTNEEKRRLLTPEVLATLSTEEYIALWRRLNPHFLSHITRQGFRDHIGGNHQGGHLEFHTGFTSATQDDRRLLTPYGVLGLRDLTDQSIISFLEKTVYPNSSDLSEAQKSFDQQVNYDYWTGNYMFADKSAAHFGWQRVEDKDYGCERNNEVFYIYPTDAIASQYDFSFHNALDGDFTKYESATYNDLHVYPKEMNKPSIPIDSGIVFLPKSTMVDPVTGSKYASEVIESDGKKIRKLIINETLVHSFNKWALTLNQPESPLKKTLISFNKLNTDMRTELQQSVERSLTDELQKLGFPSDVVLDLANETFGILQSLDNSDVQHDLDLILKKTGAIWKRAENTIQAQEYWNQYFTLHESERPKHIYFYDGDPTIAVLSFQRDNKIGNEEPDNNITSSFNEELPNQKPQNEHLLGFDDHLVQDTTKDERVLKGLNEFLSSGQRLIQEHYSQVNKGVSNIVK